ncbi:MAG: Uma2 family endonuclease [Deinococcota bacterium]|nr:Uma2 family endonuclease [Deinococcota bacterium]
MTLAKPTQDLPEVALRRFTYREMLEMARAGILAEDERVELLHGSIIAMTPINPPHAWAVSELHNHLLLNLSERAVVVSQNPLRLSANLDDDKLPLPDVMVLARRDYTDHPQPEDVYLLVEVADTTLRKDRSIKLPLYASAGVVEFWIANLVDKRIEVYTDPQGADYLTRRSYGLTEPFAPQRFPDKAQAWLTE